MGFTEVFEGIREWIRNLAAFFVLSTVLVRLLPGESYVRYVRLFLGLLLVLLLLKPVISALSAEDLFSDALYVSADAAGSSELEESIGAASAGEWEAVLAVYQDDLREWINEKIEDLGVCVTEISAEGEVLTFLLEDIQDPDAPDEEDGQERNSAGGTAKIEIPVISVFSDDTGGETENSGAAASVGEITAAVKTRIVQVCGIDEEYVEVVMEAVK